MKGKNMLMAITIISIIMIVGCKIQEEKGTIDNNINFINESNEVDEPKQPDSIEDKVASIEDNDTDLTREEENKNIIEEIDDDSILNGASSTDEPIADKNLSNNSQVSEGKVKVSIKNLLFDPDNIKIKIGDTVIWVHEDNYKGFDNLKHKITIYNVGASPILSFGDTYEYTFKKAGDYTFVDSIHTDMKGKIKVEV